MYIVEACLVLLTPSTASIKCSILAMYGKVRARYVTALTAPFEQQAFICRDSGDQNVCCLLGKLFIRYELLDTEMSV